MVKHIVIWQLKEFVEGTNKEENVDRRDRGNMPGMRHIEAALNFYNETDAADVILYSEFDSRHDLEDYQSHPVHKVVKNTY